MTGAGSIGLWQLGGFLGQQLWLPEPVHHDLGHDGDHLGTAQSSDALSGNARVGDHDRVLSGDDGTGQGYERMLNDRGSAWTARRW